MKQRHKNFEQKIKEYFVDSELATVEFSEDSYQISLARQIETADILFLKKRVAHLLLLDICSVDHGADKSERHSIFYHFYQLDLNLSLALKTPYNGTALPSLRDFFFNAKGMEIEITQMMGLDFIGPSLEEKLFDFHFECHPLLKDFTQKKIVHKAFQSSFHEYEKWCPQLHSGEVPFDIYMNMNGDKIVKSESILGDHHKGLEKLGESKNYIELLGLTRYLSSQSSLTSSFLHAHTIEKALELEIPKRAQAIRMVLLEFSRISEHLFCLGAIFHEAKLPIVNRNLIKLRESILRLFCLYGKNRVNPKAFVFGGMPKDLCGQFLGQAVELLKVLPRELDQAKSWFSSSRVFKERTYINPLTADEAISWGYTGPILRATGVNFDLRKVSPFYFYDQVEFEVPLGVTGTPFERVLVRFEEILQSLEIISQLLDHLPVGKIQEEIGLSKIELPKGAYYTSVESPSGELGEFIYSEEGERPNRIHWRTPSFTHYLSLNEMIKGHMLETAKMTLSSMNLMSSEMER